MEKSTKRSEEEAANEVEGYDGGMLDFAGDAMETLEVQSLPEEPSHPPYRIARTSVISSGLL